MTNDKVLAHGRFDRRNRLLVDIELLRKEELSQRRKIRIQQVRHQSKDIANRVLRDVHNEKARQLHKVQQDEEILRKKFQTRRLLEINVELKENIKKLGSGHRAAEAEPDPEKEIAEQSKKNVHNAQVRGKKAYDDFKHQQEVARNQNEELAARREKVRKMEGLRSTLISSLPPPKRQLIPEPATKNLKAVVTGEKRINDHNHCYVNELPPAVSKLRVEESLRDNKNYRSGQTSGGISSVNQRPPSPSVEVFDRSNPCTFTNRQPVSVRIERTSPTLQTDARKAAEEEEKLQAERLLKKENEEEVTQKRGRKALAKEMVRRDFDRFVNRLDGFAKEERIARGTAPLLPAEMYMDERRCAVREQKRQQNLDLAFEGLLDVDEENVTKDDSSTDKECPFRLERLDLPGEWQSIRKFYLSKSPPQKLNVAAFDKDTSVIDKQESRGFSGIKEKEMISDQFKHQEAGRDSAGYRPDYDDSSVFTVDECEDESRITEKMAPSADVPLKAAFVSSDRAEEKEVENLSNKSTAGSTELPSFVEFLQDNLKEKTARDKITPKEDEPESNESVAGSKESPDSVLSTRVIMETTPKAKEAEEDEACSNKSVAGSSESSDSGVRARVLKKKAKSKVTAKENEPDGACLNESVARSKEIPKSIVSAGVEKDTSKAKKGEADEACSNKSVAGSSESSRSDLSARILKKIAKSKAKKIEHDEASSNESVAGSSESSDATSVSCASAVIKKVISKVVEGLEDESSSSRSEVDSSSTSDSMVDVQPCIQQTGSGDLSLIHKPDVRDGHDHSIERKGSENVSRIEACTQTSEIFHHVGHHPCIRNNHRMQMLDVSHMSVETSKSSCSTSSSSSVTVEEVRVLLRFSGDSSSDTLKEEVVKVSQIDFPKERKKKIPPREKLTKIHEVSADEDKMVDIPDSTSYVIAENKKQGTAKIQEDIIPKPEKRKKRSKQDRQKEKRVFPMPPNDSSYLSIPSHLNVSGASRADSLLEEIRRQRRQLEDWAGLKGDDTQMKSSQLGLYVKKLLTMSRESIDELSVSDVSTPSIHLTSPVHEVKKSFENKRTVPQEVQKRVIEKKLLSKLQKVERTVSPIPQHPKPSDGKISYPETTESRKKSPITVYPPKLSARRFSSSPESSEVEVSLLQREKSTSISETSTKSSVETSSSVNGGSSPEEWSELLQRAPSPPPPSPEFEQLTDLHSRRISQLGAKLMEIREIKRKLLGSPSESESQKSTTTSDSGSSGIQSVSTESVSLKESVELVSKQDEVPQKDLNASDASLSSSNDSEDFSWIRNTSDLLISNEQIFKKSPEGSVLKPKTGGKSGPPPITLRNVRRPVLGYQVPHELSTITEVDSRIMSSTSIMEPRKEKDSLEDKVKKQEAELDLTSKSPELIQPSGKSLSFSPDNSAVLRESPVNFFPEEENVVQKSPESHAEASSPDTTDLHDESSDSGRYPTNIDDALRMLGISPTIFNRPDSPNGTRDLRSLQPVQAVSGIEVPEKSIAFREIPSNNSPSSTPKQTAITTNVKEFELRDPGQVSLTPKDDLHLSQSFGIRKSSFDLKDSRSSSHQLLHSTPVHSLSSGTSSSSSDSHHKSTFPFLTDSGPSSISGTSIGPEWRNIDESTP